MIQLQQVQRMFEVGDEKVYALDDINLQIEHGEYLSIMGPSGSGKSTLLHIVGLLDRPTKGSYSLDGQDVTTLSDVEQAHVRRDKMGFVFQSFHLISRLTAAQNVELPLMLAGVEPEERRPRVEKILEAFHLSDRAQHRPEQLSGGQRQRVAIARAAVMEPGALLADEPTGNLDRHSGKEVLDILETLNQNGITLIVITHDPEIGARSRRQIQMVDGRIVEDVSRSP